MAKGIKIMILLCSVSICCVLFSCCSGNRYEEQQETLTIDGSTVDEEITNDTIIESGTEETSDIEESSLDALDEAIKQLEELNDILQE